MIKEVTVTFSIGFRWWVRWYLYGLLIACWIFRHKPDEKRIGRWIERGLFVKSKRAPDAS